MHVRFKYALVLIAFQSILIIVFGEIRLPAVIGNNMVLQQRTAVSLWGWGGPGERITVSNSWSKSIDTTISTSDGRWKVNIQTPVAGGPYTITFKGQNSITLENVLIGEVWVCSGQSNMEWSALNNNKQALEEAPNATNNQIRFFHIPRTTSEYPQDDCRASWKVCNPEDMKKFSSIGYFFGKKLNKELKVPVGLINTSWGGTPAEVWTPKDVIDDDKLLLEAANKIPENPWGPVTAGKAYNAMVYPITNYSIAGAIWYQGETNTLTAYMYTRLLSSMIQSWRQAWAIDFPFYYVQIAPYGYGTEYAGPLLREAQTKVKLSKTNMVVISDLVDNVNDIHPQNKADVATRLANMALAQTYSLKSGPYKYPTYKNMTVDGDKIRIEFENVESGLMTKNGEPAEFTIAGDDKVFYKATAKIEGNAVVVMAKEVKKPVAVRFGFKNKSIPNLFSKEGLPVNLFRTDDWDSGTISEK